MYVLVSVGNIVVDYVDECVGHQKEKERMEKERELSFISTVMTLLTNLVIKKT